MSGYYKRRNRERVRENVQKNFWVLLSELAHSDDSDEGIDDIQNKYIYLTDILELFLEHDLFVTRKKYLDTVRSGVSMAEIYAKKKETRKELESTLKFIDDLLDNNGERTPHHYRQPNSEVTLCGKLAKDNSSSFVDMCNCYWCQQTPEFEAALQDPDWDSY